MDIALNHESSRSPDVNVDSQGGEMAAKSPFKQDCIPEMFSALENSREGVLSYWGSQSFILDISTGGFESNGGGDETGRDDTSIRSATEHQQ